MNLTMFSVRDAKVEAFLQPFFAPTSGSAIRSLSDAVNDPKHDFFKHVNDYSLWIVGTWDDATGTVVPENPPKALLNCVELVTTGN